MRPFLPLAAFFLTITLSLFSGESAVAPVVQAAPSIPAIKPALLDRVITLNKVHEPELDEAALRVNFSALVEKARTALTGKQTAKEKIAALNATLLAERKVSYLSNKYWRDATLAACVVRTQGNCLSTSTLYTLIGKELGLPVKMVLIPGHAFVRWDDGKEKINIETTSGGNEIADSTYLSRGQQPAPDDIERLRVCASLSEDEFLGELMRVAARFRASENKQDEALKLLEEAQTLLPGRSDVALERIELRADATNERASARLQVLKLLSSPEYAPLPSSVAASALMYLAQDAAATGDHEEERAYLLSAYAAAPKAQQLGVLTQLGFCYRALKDFRASVRVMELAAVLDPQNPSTLYNLAILQKCDGKLPEALKTIRMARKLNPESWNLQILEAGYLVLNGNRDEGTELYSKLEKPRGDTEFWNIMQAWYHSAARNDAQFYESFEYALKESKTTGILEWIDQDPDLDPYREQERFMKLVREHRTRLTEK